MWVNRITESYLSELASKLKTRSKRGLRQECFLPLKAPRIRGYFNHQDETRDLEIVYDFRYSQLSFSRLEFPLVPSNSNARKRGQNHKGSIRILREEWSVIRKKVPSKLELAIVQKNISVFIKMNTLFCLRPDRSDRDDLSETSVSPTKY